MVFNNLIEAAEWLGETVDVAKLKRLKDLTDNQRFYMTVWGHYSAGKSMLINNILHRDILPVQSRETTAVLTYIQYGIEEKCVVIYDNGSVVDYDINILKNIFQDTCKFEEVGKIDHIEVYLCDDILSTGLILVDTPGVNTVIEKHQDLAVDAIEQSGRLIYVLGNSPSNVDRQFIKQISECGIKISFVRTKCDRFNSHEENPEISLGKEKEELEDFTGGQVDFIPVSNMKESKWNDNIQKVREMLNRISKTISEEMVGATNNRLTVFAKKYLAGLLNEVEQLNQIRTGNTDKMDEEIRKCEKDIKILGTVMEDIERKVEKRVSEAKKESQKEMDQLISAGIENFANTVSKVEYTANMSTDIKIIYERHLSNMIVKIQNILNTYFEDIIQSEMEKIADSVSAQTLNLPIPTYAEVQQENSRILEMYNSRLLELKNEIEYTKEQCIVKREALDVVEAEFNESDYEEALSLLEKKLEEIPSGMALRLADKQHIQPSTVFKGIGNAVDIALLLVPGDAIVAGIKGLANTTKIAQTLHKMGKAGQVIVKAGNAISQNAKTIDRARDTAYALNQLIGRRKYSTKAEREAAERLVTKAAEKGGEAFERFKEDKKSGNVLDALSVGYWTEKLGKRFDSEPKMEIDREEEDRRKQLRREITVQQQQLCDERIKMREKMNGLKNEEAKLNIKVQEEEKKRQRIEEQIQKEEQKIIEQARAEGIKKYKKEYKLYFTESITSLAENMSSQCFMLASQNITMYVAAQSQKVMERIERKKCQLQDICSLKEKDDKEIMVKIEKCNELKMKLEMMIS